MRFPFDGSYPETQGFGVNPADYAKFGLRGHDGLDYGLPSHTPVLAPHSGKIIEAASDPPGYGNYIKIENDIEGSVLAHLLSFNVVVGANVNEGDLIGYSDNTGNSTGPHLHWGYYRFPRDRSNGFGGFIDQTQYIGQNEPVPTPQPPTPPVIVEEQISISEVIINIYRALTGQDPTQDEINARISENQNGKPISSIMEDVIQGDVRFKDRWSSLFPQNVTPAPPVVTTVYTNNEPVFTSSIAKWLYQQAKNFG